jgi:hypothetical protein
MSPCTPPLLCPALALTAPYWPDELSGLGPEGLRDPAGELPALRAETGD